VAGAYTTASLDVPARDTTGEGGPLLSDVLGEEDNALALAELRVSAAPAVAALPERDRRILHLRFFANLTQDQIAAQIGISQMHVSRLLARALDTLRDQLREPSAGARDQGTPERGTAEPGRAERGTGRRPPDSARLTEPPARRGVSERPPGRPPIPAGAAVPTGAPERGNHDRGAPGGRAGPGRRRRRGDPPR
jgi:hypothetical protein